MSATRGRAAGQLGGGGSPAGSAASASAPTAGPSSVAGEACRRPGASPARRRRGASTTSGPASAPTGPVVAGPVRSAGQASGFERRWLRAERRRARRCRRARRPGRSFRPCVLAANVGPAAARAGEFVPPPSAALARRRRPLRRGRSSGWRRIGSAPWLPASGSPAASGEPPAGAPPSRLVRAIATAAEVASGVAAGAPPSPPSPIGEAARVGRDRTGDRQLRRSAQCRAGQAAGLFFFVFQAGLARGRFAAASARRVVVAAQVRVGQERRRVDVGQRACFIGLGWAARRRRLAAGHRADRGRASAGAASLAAGWPPAVPAGAATRPTSAAASAICGEPPLDWRAGRRALRRLEVELRLAAARGATHAGLGDRLRGPQIDLARPLARGRRAARAGEHRPA